MLNNPRTSPPSNGHSKHKRNGFIGDSKTILLIPRALSDKKWGSLFTDLENKLEIEFTEMPRDTRISKVFATLRGLCLGPEVVMSLNRFEQKYYDMEYRIKIQNNSHSRSTPSESTADLTIKRILDEKSSIELSDIVDLDHIFGPKNPENHKGFNDIAHNTLRSHQMTYEDREPSNGVDYLDGDSSSSPYSDSTVLGHGHGRLYPHLALPNSGSTHYLSPSALGSPATLRLEAFSPMLSPVRENKAVEGIWRDDSLYLTPIPNKLGLQFPSPSINTPIKEPISRLPSLYQRKPGTCPPGCPGVTSQPESPRVIRQRRYAMLSNSGLSSILRPHSDIRQDKALPPITQVHSSPEQERGSLGILKSRCSSEPTSLLDDPKRLRITRLRSSPNTSFTGTLPLSPTVTIRKNYPRSKITIEKIDKPECRSFEILQSRNTTPTIRVAGEKTVRNKHRSMEMGARSSYISTKSAITTTSESSSKTVTPYSQSAAPIFPKRTIPKRPEPSTLNNSLNSSPKYPGRHNNRVSITPSLLSSSTNRGDSFRSGGDIYEDKNLRRENSATSTILSTATNSTGDIPNFVLGIFSDSSVRCVPGAPRLIEVTKNTYGGKSPVSLERVSMKQPKTVSDSSTKSLIHSMKSIDMIDEKTLEVRPPVTGDLEKSDPTIKKANPHDSTPKIPNPKNSSRRVSIYENTPKVKDSTIKLPKKNLETTHRGLDGAKKEPELGKSLGQKINTKEVPKALTPRLSPKQTIYSASHQKLAIGRSNDVHQRNSSRTGGMENPGKSNQRASSAGNETSQRNTSVLGTEKDYMRPLSKEKFRQYTYCSPPRTQSSGNLTALSKPSSRSRGQPPGNRRLGQTTFIDRENSKSLDSLRMQRTPQDTTNKDILLTTVASKNTSKFSHRISKLATNIPPTVVERHDPPTKSKKLIKGSILVDITGIGCGSNPRTTPIGGRSWFGRRSTGSSFIHPDFQKENTRPCKNSDQQHPHPTTIETPKPKQKPLGNITSWLSRGSSSVIQSRSFHRSATNKTKERYSPVQPNGQFSQDEVDNLIKRLSAQLPQTPDEKNGFNALGGRYYTLSIPSLDKSPSKDEKDRNPIAVCMDLINAASNEPQSPRRERLLQMSRVMVDAVSKSRDAECAAEEAKMAARRAEVAFLETKRHLIEMTELMKNRKQDI